MSGHEDTEATRRQKAPYTGHHPIPTIKGFRQEKEARQAEAREYGGDQDNNTTKDVANRFMSPAQGQGGDGKDQSATNNSQQSAGGAQNGDANDDNTAPAVDTSEAQSSAQDPSTRRKALKNRKDERAEREVTDPVTHLPVIIHDMTSQALKEVPQNEEPPGTSNQTSTGLGNKKKTAKQLHGELKKMQESHASMQNLFPPPDMDEMKQELADVYKKGIALAVAGIASVLLLVFGFERFMSIYIFSSDTPRALVVFTIWIWPTVIALATVWGLVVGMRQWMSKRIDSIWDAGVWDAGVWDAEATSKDSSDSHDTETVAWLNSLLGAVWPLVNPDLFTSLADTLEDVMQASLPKVVEMVSVDDVGQGSEAVRILGIRWLPTGAAARSVTEDGKLKDPGDESNHSNDRKVPGQGSVESDDQGDSNDQGHSKDQDSTQNANDGSQQQVAEGLEAEEGDFVNMEVAFAYRARSQKKSLKDRAQDLHLYMAFYLPGSLKVPVWVDLRGLVGTVRMRLQLCPDPPFFSLCTLTFLGQPKVDLRCTPLSRHALNIMDVPLISNFVQSSVDAAMAQYVAPKSLNLDLQDMLAGEDYKKDTVARGVLVVHVKRGYDFKEGDPGIPLIKSGSSDPYVSVGWAKFGKPLWSTRLLLNEMEPWWDETAYILVTPEELNVRERLRLQLWDSDRLTADDDLGRIEVDLKELMTNSESNGRMWDRSDGFRALKAGESMPGKLEWSVGYFSKTRITDRELKRQTFDSSVQTTEQLKEKVDYICQRKLREASVKEGRHQKDADELEQQKAQEYKRIQDAMIISAPPPDDYPSGVLSIVIHQITGLELQKLNKTDADKDAEADDEAEEGEDLPSAYCSIILNHSKIFKTRTKPKNARPFYNAGTERFVSDWRSAEVYIAVRDARAKEDDALLGIVHLPLSDVFQDRSQTNGFYPIAGGVGFGRIRVSMVWRSVQWQAPAEAIGWNCGTLEIQSSVAFGDVSENLRTAKLTFHTDLGSGKFYPGKGEEGWHSKRDRSLKLPVRQRYSSCLAIQFRHNKTLGASTAAFAILWLKDVRDEESQEIELSVWKGDYERAQKNALPEPGEKLGSITLKVKFWEGLGSAHAKWANKNENMKEVKEVLDVARDNYETRAQEEKAGIVEADDNATTDGSDLSDSSDDSDDDDNDDDGKEAKDGKKGLVRKATDLKEHHKNLNRQNRGMMQWRLPRTAKWALGKAEKLESKVEGMFEHHTRQPDVETEV